MAKIKITLIRGLTSKKPNQVRTAKSLGLTKRNSSVVKDDNDAIRGMVETIAHMVRVEEV
ncbi:MAG: 50S ribosomal protein L30 [Candidatus Izemoplasmatales bacterium]|jgi:large subunit ribosomal protein L30